jgi:lysophospholipase
MADLALHDPTTAGEEAAAAAEPVRRDAPAPLPTIRLGAADGLALRAAFVRPRTIAPRATVVLLTGRAEFIEKYAPTIGDLTGLGFAVAALDWRGQGGSSRLIAGAPGRGHVRDYRYYLDDLDTLLAAATAEGLPGARLMIATSMGGHIGLRHLAERPCGFAGAALIAPMVDIHFGALPHWLVDRAARLAVRLGRAERYAFGQHDPDCNRSPFASNRLTGSAERYAAWLTLQRDHPELGLGGVTFGWLDASLRSIASLRRPGWAERLDLPVLVLQAGADRVVSNAAQDALVARLPRGRLVRLPGARHDLLWEDDTVRERAFDAIATFLDGCLEPAGERVLLSAGDA